MTHEALLALGYELNPSGTAYSKYLYGFMLTVALRPKDQIYLCLRLDNTMYDATGSCYHHLLAELKLKMTERLLNLNDKLEHLS